MSLSFSKNCNSPPKWAKSQPRIYSMIMNKPHYRSSKSFNGIFSKTLPNKSLLFATNNNNLLPSNLWDNTWKIFEKEPKNNVFIKCENKAFRFGTEAFLPTSLDCLNYIKSGPSNTVAINLNKLTIPLMCIDIDNAEIGYRIIQLYKGNYPKISFQEIFGNPLVIKSVTPGHIHLYYKIPKFLINTPINQGKSEICNRLGFSAEHIFSFSIFSQITRTPVNIPTSLNDISFLPEILYPYNWQTRGTQIPEFKNNLHSSRSGKHTKYIGNIIPEGRRHNTLFEWCNVFNFTESQVRAIVYLTCENPLTVTERQIINFVNIPSKRKTYKKDGPLPEWFYYDKYSSNNQNNEIKKGDNEEPTLKETLQQFVKDFNLENNNNLNSTEQPFKTNQSQTIYRLRDNENLPETKHETLLENGLYSSKKDISFFQNLNFNPDRAKKALMYHFTSLQVMQAVAILELREDIFLDDNEWMGQSLETLLLNCLARFNKLDILFIGGTKWYLWDSKIWNQVFESEILVYLYQQLKSLELGGFEKSVNKSDYLKGLKDKVSLPKWPDTISGISFNNGTFTFDSTKKESIFVSHQKNHFIQHKWDFDFDDKATLSPLAIRFILDTCGHDVYNINIFRLILYNIFFEGHGQFGVFLQGDPGGSKSTFMKLLQKLNPKNTSTLDPSSFSRNKFQIYDLVIGKSLLFIPDVSPKSIKSETIEFVKGLLGRDYLFAEKKGGLFTNFISFAFVIIVSNFMFNEIPEFRDPAIYQRLIQFTFPTIKSDHKISNIDDLLLEDPSGLIKWVFNIDKNFVEKTIRSNEINDLVSIITNPIELFFQSKVSATSNTFVSNKQLFEEYINFCEVDSTFKENIENYDVSKITLRSFLKGFDFILSKYANNIIQKGRKTKGEKGYVNALILKDNETKDMFIENKDIVKKSNNTVHFLNTNPWLYYGDLFYNKKNGFVQIQNSNAVYEQVAKATCYLVYNNSIKNLLNPNSIKQKLPFDHLYLPNTNGPLVHKFFNWDPSLLPFWNYSTNIRNSLNINSDLIQNVLNNVNFKNNKGVEVVEKDKQQELENLKDEFSLNQNQANNDNLKDSQIVDTKLKINNNKGILDESSNERVNSIDHNKNNDHNLVKSKSQEDTTNNSRTILTNLMHEVQLNELPGNYIYKSISKNEYQIIYVKIKKEDVIDNRKDFLYFRKLMYEKIFVINDDFYKIEEIFTSCNENYIKWFNSKFANPPWLLEDENYNSFSEPYKHAKWYENAIKDSLIFLPQHFIPLIDKLLPSYKDIMTLIVDEIFPLRNRDQSDFFSRKFPGFSDSAIAEQKTRLIDLTKNQKESQQNNISKFPGYSLFPFLYVPGKDSYQRLDSVPSITISNISNVFKSEILSFYSQMFSFVFIEIDIKSCHSVIFNSLSKDLEDINNNDLPDLKNLWNILEQEFRDSYEKHANKQTKSYVDIVKSWDSLTLKSLLKSVWYKALNAGDYSQNTQLLNDYSKELNIEKGKGITFNSHLSKVFLNMKSLKPLSQFKSEINKFKNIHLATQVEPFDTSTLSGSELVQKGQNLLSAGRTGMSRVLTSCEIVLIMILLDSTIKNPITGPLIPISYEKDGFLLMGLNSKGKFNLRDYQDAIFDIDLSFNSYSRNFLKGEFNIVAKKIWFGDKIILC